MRILNVVGARPNFMKIAPLMAEYRRRSGSGAILVHTGQHYDGRMSQLFFDQLGIPEPDVNLEVGSGSHAAQTAEIMKRFEPVMAEFQPDVVVVVGDVNSTIACGLVAAKLGVRLAHVEAGLRSFDRSMPEEINRILTDAISDLLFCTEQSGVDNLVREGISPEKVYLVGNVMIDTLLHHKAKARQSTILDRLNLAGRRYAVLTLHRPANVEDPQVLGQILDALEVIVTDMPVIFPVHPRTREQLQTTSAAKQVCRMTRLSLIEPLGYLDFLRLMSEATIMLTDSGGIQEETTVLNVPCLTLRENTERPVTVTYGTNRIVGQDTQQILRGYQQVLATNRCARIPPLWDGQAAPRIVDILFKTP